MTYGVLDFFLTDTLSSCEKHTLLHAYKRDGRVTKHGPNIYKSAKPLLSYRSVCVVFFGVFYHMFAFICVGYHLWEKFFTYHCCYTGLFFLFFLFFITCLPSYSSDITNGKSFFSHTTAMMSQWIITQYC